jgi:hypothetical protein
MKKICTLFIFLVFITFINAQEKRILFKGKTVLDSLTIGNVHVINKNTNIGTISNDSGLFEIPIKIGDSLLFSHVTLENKLILVNKKILVNKSFTVNLQEKVYTLNEITLEKPRSIFYQDKEIGSYNGPSITAKTLNLPYANTTIKKETTIFKIRSGGVVSLDNLISSINGTKKREKLLKKMVSEDSELAKIRKQYTDDFFITDLKIKKEYINPFLNYCVNKNIIRIFKESNRLDLTTLLIKESKTFPHKKLDEDLFLTKK